MTRRVRFTLAGVTSLAIPASAAACPLCESPTGEQVRAGIFAGGDFWANLVAVVAPFVVCSAVVAAIHFGAPLRPRK